MIRKFYLKTILIDNTKLDSKYKFKSKNNIIKFILKDNLNLFSE